MPAASELVTPVELLQHPEEFAALLDLYRAAAPAAVLEIGAGAGGSLYHWLRNAEPGTLVVSIDDQHRNLDLYDGWTPPDVELVAIHGHSHAVGTVEQAERLGLYDWLFIDADHHLAAVRLDFRLYAPLIRRRPGIIVLHDIKPSDDPDIQVATFWAELRQATRTIELVADDGYGIGVAYTV